MALSVAVSISFVFSRYDPKVALGLVCLLGRVDNVTAMEFGLAMFDDMDAVLFCYKLN